MPKIPKFESNQILQSSPMSPGAAAAPFTALAQGGEELQRTAAWAGNIFEQIEEKERDAIRAVKASQLENDLKDDLLDVSESYKNRMDYENFESDADKAIVVIREKYKPLVGDDPKLANAFEIALGNQGSDLKRVAKAKKLQVVTDIGLGEFEKSYNAALHDYAIAQTPEEKEMIRNKIEIQAEQMELYRIMTPKQKEEKVNSFAQRAQEVEARQAMFIDPETAATKLQDPKNYPDMNENTRIHLQESAERQAETKVRKALADDEHLEKALAKAHKAVLDKNDFDMWQKYYSDTLTGVELEKMASSRMISESSYRAIRDKWKSDSEKPDKEENDPVVVGNIAEQIELRDLEGAKNHLEDAKKRGLIKGETYIAMRKALGDKAYSDAVTFINRAMQPSDLDLDFYRKQKHADALASLATRAASGENPIEAAKDIVKLNQNRESTSVNRYANPRFIGGGKKDDPVALDKAEQETVARYNKGQLTVNEYRTEMRLIADIRKALENKERSSQAIIDIGEEQKKRGLGK